MINEEHEHNKIMVVLIHILKWYELTYRGMITKEECFEMVSRELDKI